MSYGGGSGGSGRISTSSDVALNTPADGQVLTYVASTQKWTNAATGGSGGGDSVSAGSFSITSDGINGTGSISSGSATLSFATGGLTSGHVGASVRVNGAGASGAVLVTTIASVANATTATLAASASTAASATTVLVGHNNLSALGTALTAASGKTLTFPSGTYYLSGQLTIPANTTVDAAGATFLYGGFTIGKNTTLQNGTFLGDGAAIYGSAVSWPTSGADDAAIIGNTFANHAWGILHNVQASTTISHRALIKDNRFDSMHLGCTYIGNCTDMLFMNNVSTNITAGCNTFNFQNTQQRNSIIGNVVNGGRAGIIHLWTYGYSPAPTATQSWECYGNYIAGNKVIGQSEEGISFDGNNGFDNATVSSVNTGSKQVTLAASAWAGAGSKWAYSWVTFLSGALASRIYRITAMANAVLTLDIDATDIAAVVASDTLVIGAPFHHNTITGNYMDSRKTSTYAIWLYSGSSFNVVSGNTIEGGTIGTASLNAMAPVSDSITGTTYSLPSGYNVFSGNAISGYSTVTATYQNGPGIMFDYVNYGNQTDYYTYGNIAADNVLPNGTIVGQYNQKLTANNVARGGTNYTNTPSGGGGGLTFV